MLVAIIVIFVICWAPITINNLLVAFKVLPPLHFGFFKYMREAFHIMSYANSCVNPVVYGFMSKNFRQTFKRSLCSCVRGRDYVRRQVFKSQTEHSLYSEDPYPNRWVGVAETSAMLSHASIHDGLNDELLDMSNSTVKIRQGKANTGI